MRRTEDITFGVTGQTLLLRVLSGRPQSATFAVMLDDYGDDATDYTPEFSGSGTVDTVNTTVDVISGPSAVSGDPKRLNLASTTGIETGRKYLLEENSMKAWIEPVEIVSGQYVTLRHALLQDWSTSATLKSTYVSFAIDATWVADEDQLSDVGNPFPDYRLRAAVVNASGDTEIHYLFFDLVRAPIDHSVVLADLARRWPSLMVTIPHDLRQEQGQPIVDAAWRALRADFAVLGLNDAAMRDHEAIDEAVILKARLHLAEAGYYPPNWDAPSFYAMAKESFDAFFEQNYRVTLKRPVATGSSGGVEDQPLARAFWRK